MLGEITNQSISAKKQSERLDNSTLSTVVRSYQDVVRSKPKTGLLDSAKPLNLKLCNLHGCLNAGPVYLVVRQPTVLRSDARTLRVADPTAMLLWIG